MPDHATLAVGAAWRERLDGALETVECHCLAALCYLKSLVVVVAASIANTHSCLLGADHAVAVLYAVG